MKRLLLTTALLSASLGPVSATTIALGGHFNAGFASGFVDVPGSVVIPDQTRLVFGTPVSFSAPEIWPTLDIVTVATPWYGPVSVQLTSIDYQVINSAGDFFQLEGVFTGAESGHAVFDVNLVNPGFGIPSFGLFGSFAYTPPYIPPPPCLDCNPPPPITVPETSTWFMMFIGLSMLATFKLFKTSRQRTMLAVNRPLRVS